MSSLPRLLVIMGSGETSPTMVKTHRSLLDRLGPPPVPAVLLDTPFGFQENADELTAKAVEYFAKSVGQPIDVAAFRSADDDALSVERALNRVRDARYVFSGPGSPTYALRQWEGSPITDLLRQKLQSGGCVVFASAAAVTLGVMTVPVYEIYKVGEAPRWLPGLDLLREAGLSAAVIPHFDNAEGGTHDTRFCYLGETRLARLEAELPEETFVLGVDEHTALILDLDAGSATVVGRGVVTARHHGAVRTFSAGSELPIADLAAEGARSFAEPVAGPSEERDLGTDHERATGRSPFVEAVSVHEAAFAAALTGGDANAAAAAILGIDDELTAWVADTLQSDDRERARAGLRSMVARLGAVATRGTRDPATLVGPFVEGLLAARQQARNDRRFADADGVRDLLVSLGVEVNDSPEGTTWHLHSDASDPSDPS